MEKPSTTLEFEIDEKKLEITENQRPKRLKSKFINAEPEDINLAKKSKVISCSVCPEKKHFASMKLYQKHLRKFHDEVSERKVGAGKIIICEICSAELKSEAYFKRHMETRHPKTEKIFACDNCGKTFNHKDYLRVHMDRHRIHQILTCTVCQKSYISKHTFRRHLKMHIEKHICSFCGLIFNQKTLLENHYATKHCDDLPIKCQFCTRLFASKTARNNHHYIAHKNSKTELSFKCKTCNVYFEMKEELRIHSFIHFDGEIKTCLECDQIFKTNRLLNIHMQKHQAKKSFQCTQCGDYFTFKTGLAKHIRLNRCKGPSSTGGDDGYTLDEGTIAEIALGQLKNITKSKALKLTSEPEVVDNFDDFFDDAPIEMEIKEQQEKVIEYEIEVEEYEVVDDVKTKETRKFRKSKTSKSTDVKMRKGRAHLIYTCDYCGEKIKFKKEFLNHIKEHTINQRYKCKDCLETFKSRRKLVNHSIEAHGTKLQVVMEAFTCETCGRKFDAKSTFEAHKLSHDDYTRNHICSVCSAAFKSVGNLRRHEAIHATTRDYHCDSCQKTFKTQLALKIHIEAVHAETKVFVNCGICKAIVQEKHLNQHIKNRHTEEGQEKPFECSVCSKTFKTFQLGQRHYEAVHEPKNRGVVYTCSLCPELQFYRQRELKEHSFIHFEGTIFQCDQCLKMFKSKRLLIIHQASHDEAGFPCKMCDVVFKTRGGRRKHILRVHKAHDEVDDMIEFQELEDENEKQTFMLS